MKNLAPIVENEDVINKQYVDNGFQATLVSGTNIKTINNESILGSGNISVGGNEIYIGDEQDAPATTKLVIEEQQAEWDGLPISNTYNTTTNNTYSCDYINTKANTYSTTETRVGTWINRKTFV